MLRQLKGLNISLAAKCQIVFGAAVVLIISAALFVPWQRMEQLTDELNEKPAATLARFAVAEHIRAPHRTTFATTLPATAPAPATRPTTNPDAEVLAVRPPRLIGVRVLTDNPNVLTRFEQSAMLRFRTDRSLPMFARTYDTPNLIGGGYRYALPLYATASCVECHQPPRADEASTARPATMLAAATTSPLTLTTAATAAESTATTRPSSPELLGLVSVDISSQVSSRQKLLNRVFILTAGLIAGTLAIIIFYLVTTRLILQPVRVLQETAEKVSEGDLNIRSDINTGDEFQVLSETFNTMLSNLKRSSDQLREVNKSLDLKLGQLAESNVALYESNRLKSEFLANVSHELRTPLNSILGFAELLKDATGGAATADAKGARYLANILSAGHNLLDLINDLLDLAKIEAGRMDVRVETFSIADLFEALTSVLRPLTEPKQLTIVSRVGEDVPILETDPSKLQQILYNFLSNAIKFSPAGETIGLAAELEATGAVRVSVSDRGPGIDQAMHGVIFEKFRQIDGSVTRQHSGTGLGLAISKELSTLLGGSIGLSSAPGEGACFFVRLPIRIESSAADVRGRTALSA